ncbi:hypothetical protein ACFXJO_18055 [Streptomyces lavendulae]|uniref:hypothetical protein n=1 Tax=Streptomyces lavendulae TaxID=1914 RepID=UPI00367DD374
MINAGFHEVPGTDIPGMLDEAARQGVPVFTLSTAGRTDQEAFVEAVWAALPLDPPLASGTVWDAISDSVGGGLHELKSPRVVIVCPDARPVAGAEGDFPKPAPPGPGSWRASRPKVLVKVQGL